MTEVFQRKKKVYCTKILSRKTAKQTCGTRLGSVCGSRTEAMQKNSLAAVIHKHKRNVAGKRLCILFLK